MSSRVTSESWYIPRILFVVATFRELQGFYYEKIESLNVLVDNIFFIFTGCGQGKRKR